MLQKLFISTLQKSCALRITLHAKHKTRVVLEGIDAHQKHTAFFKRERVCKGKTVLQVNLPLSPSKLLVKVASDAQVEVQLNLIALPLRERVEISEETADFIDFAIDFCLHASYLPTNQIYTNELGEFSIEYVPRLFSAEGVELPFSPAKVHRGTGHITINSTLFRTYTLPMRAFIVFHEWFHHHRDTSNETEVDIYALQVYLALGFPKLEVINATAGLFEDKEGLLSRVEIILEYLKKYQETPVCNRKRRCA